MIPSQLSNYPCPTISSSFNIISNNSPTKYGTASLINNNLNVTNIQFDSSGRVIVFDVCDMTMGNVYLPSGTDNIARSKREEYSASVLPKLLLNRLDRGCLGGDFNCITNEKDCSSNPGVKKSPIVCSLIKLLICLTVIVSSTLQAHLSHNITPVSPTLLATLE